MFRIPGVTSVLRLPRVVLQRALLESSSATGAEVEQEVPVKQNFDNEQTRIKITLPLWSVGPLIGPKHENLIQMKKDCRTNLQLSKWGHFFPGSHERVLIIEGETENVLKTIHKIYDTVRVMEVSESLNNPNPDAAKRRQNVIRFIAPLSLADDLKGLERGNESHIKTKFKLDQFNVYTGKLYDKDFKERVIHIEGDEENVKDAVGFVVQRLSSGPKVDSNLNYRFVYKPMRIKITLPWWCVGPLIGPKHENLIQIKKDCKTILQLSNWGNFFPGYRERVLLIEGETEDVLKTIYKVYDTVRVMEIPESVNNPDAAKTRQNGIRLVTPLSLAEDLKGLERENESHTKTKFKLDQFYVFTRKQFDNDFKERVIHIGGNEENVKDAVGFVVERLSSGPKVDRNLNYRFVYKPIRIKITLPLWSVGRLMGPQSEYLIQMEKDCKTNLKISEWGHFFPGSFERVLLIEGDIENVLKTIHKIYDTVRVMEVSESLNNPNPDAAKRRQNVIRFIAPLSLADDLKGGNESHIKTKFKLDQFNVYTGKLYDKDFKERVIHIRGDEENVKDAVGFVVERLISGPQVDSNLNYRQFYLST